MIKYLYSLLEIPWVYRVVTQTLALGYRRFRKKIDAKVFTKPARRTLDVGCGPDLNGADPQGLLVGLDINRAYIEQYTGGYVDTDPGLVLSPPAGRRRLGYLASGDSMPFADRTFDEIRATSFFHHLPDEIAEKSIQEMIRCLEPGGRLVLFDAVFPEPFWRRPLAYTILKFDRGRHMRTEGQLSGLCQKAVPGDWTWERHTYTYTGLELLCLQYHKKPVTA